MKAKRLEFPNNPIYNPNMNQATNLFSLQRTDSRLDVISQRVEVITRLLDSNTELQNAKTQLRQKQEIFDKARRVLKKAEDDVKAAELKVQQNEVNLYSGNIRNPKELQDLQSENESLKRRISSLEDVQLEAMLEFEETESEKDEAEKLVNVIEAKLIEESAHLQGEREQLLIEKKKLETEREAILGPITRANLDLYHSLRERKDGLAVARVADDTCSGCGSIVRQAKQQDAMQSDTMATCDACGRILYVG